MTGVLVIVAGSEREQHELQRAKLRMAGSAAAVVLNIRDRRVEDQARGLLVQGWAMSEWAAMDPWAPRLSALLAHLEQVTANTPAQEGVASVAGDV